MYSELHFGSTYILSLDESIDVFTEHEHANCVFSDICKCLGAL